MTEKCFDEGTIQAFLDGELETDLLERVARHTADCDVCAFMLQDAEEEASMAFSIIGNEFNSLVPTERIRTNLYEAIAQIEKPKTSFWSRIFGTGFSFTNPSLVAFASLLLVFGLFATLYINREVNKAPADKTISSTNAKLKTQQQAPASDVSTNNQTVQPEGPEIAKYDPEKEVEKAPRPVYKGENQPRFERVAYRPERSSDNRRPKPAFEAQPLPGEESYVKTIATLSDNVNNNKDVVLRPSERVAFEKDMAVVNDAINKMQKEVRKNPKNEAAKQILRSSYQNKIDLLNSVAERSELMATR